MNLPSFDFTNWREHPSDNRYTVFFFKSELESNFFKQLLEKHNYWFEYNYDNTEPTYHYFFAVNKVNEKDIIKLNHLSIGEFRKPFLQFPILRYGLVIFMVIILTIAIIGYLKTQ
ncbi:MAG: hypothetical protein ACPGRC_00545 [Salibacteraceae bacterium]